MKTLQEVLVEAQAVVTDLQALVDAQVPVVTPETTEVDLVLSDGTVKKFIPA